MGLKVNRDEPREVKGERGWMSNVSWAELNLSWARTSPRLILSRYMSSWFAAWGRRTNKWRYIDETSLEVMGIFTDSVSAELLKVIAAEHILITKRQAIPHWGCCCSCLLLSPVFDVCDMSDHLSIKLLDRIIDI